MLHIMMMTMKAMVVLTWISDWWHHSKGRCDDDITDIRNDYSVDDRLAWLITKAPGSTKFQTVFCWVCKFVNLQTQQTNLQINRHLQWLQLTDWVDYKGSRLNNIVSFKTFSEIATILMPSQHRYQVLSWYQESETQISEQISAAAGVEKLNYLMWL